MPTITISESVHSRVGSFLQVVESVIDQKISFDDCIELILSQGIDSMLANLLSSTDQSILVSSLQQLGSQYPAEVYGYVSETLKRGAAAHERERLKRNLGF